MAKVPNSVIGVDIGRYALKSVVLQRRGPDRLALTHFGSHVPAEPATTADALAAQLKLLFKDMGGSAKACAVSVSSPETLLRIIEQPDTPVDILRDALRLNGMALLNQDCRSFVLDCDRISASSAEVVEGQAPRYKFLVGGLPRTEVEQVGAAVSSASHSLYGMQLAPISVFNAFELAEPEVFAGSAFFLLDIGHTTSTVMVGAKKELMLIRTVDFGGKSLLDALSGLSGESRESIIQALDQEDEMMVEYSRVATNSLSREIQSSIGFFEHNHDQAIRDIYISGGPAKSRTFLKLMAEELGLPCHAWNAVERCEVTVSAARKNQLQADALDLNVACGTAAAILNGN
ncbi:MAG: pilus assembly protein PilM [Chthoniobacteraceae bacterium]